MQAVKVPIALDFVVAQTSPLVDQWINPGAKPSHVSQPSHLFPAPGEVEGCQLLGSSWRRSRLGLLPLNRAFLVIRFGQLPSGHHPGLALLQQPCFLWQPGALLSRAAQEEESPGPLAPVLRLQRQMMTPVLQGAAQILGRRLPSLPWAELHGAFSSDSASGPSAREVALSLSARGSERSFNGWPP